MTPDESYETYWSTVQTEVPYSLALTLVLVDSPQLACWLDSFQVFRHGLVFRSWLRVDGAAVGSPVWSLDHVLIPGDEAEFVDIAVTLGGERFTNRSRSLVSVGSQANGPLASASWWLPWRETLPASIKFYASWATYGVDASATGSLLSADPPD